MIICDTSVWYWIADGSFDPNPHKEDGHKFIATALNLRELSSSEVLIEDPAKFKSALNAMLDHADSYILEDPIDYILRNYFAANHQSDLSVYEEMKNKIIECKDFDTSIIYSSIGEYRKEIEKFDEFYIGFADSFNTNIDEIRIGLKKEHIRNKNIKKRDTTKRIANMVFGFLESRNNSTEGVTMDPKLLEHISLLCYGFDFYFKNLETIANFESKPNHIYDLFNLAYVDTQDKYAAFDWKEPYYSLQEDGKTSYYFPIKKMRK